MPIGGGETIMKQVTDPPAVCCAVTLSVDFQHARKLETQQRVADMAKKGEEFVFTNEADVKRMFYCTACKRVSSALNRAVVGRVSMTENAKQDGLTRVVNKITEIVAQICEVTLHIKKNPPVKEGSDSLDTNTV